MVMYLRKSPTVFKSCTQFLKSLEILKSEITNDYRVSVELHKIPVQHMIDECMIMLVGEQTA